MSILISQLVTHLQYFSIRQLLLILLLALLCWQNSCQVFKNNQTKKKQILLLSPQFVCLSRWWNIVGSKTEKRLSLCGFQLFNFIDEEECVQLRQPQTMTNFFTHLHTDRAPSHKQSAFDRLQSGRYLCLTATI